MHRNYGAATDDSIPAKQQYFEQNAPSESTVKPRTALGCSREGHSKIDVSIILPVHNASSWLQECLQSVLEQDFHGNMELSIFNDASKDDCGSIIEKWTPRLENRGIAIVTSGHNSIQPKGVGYAKNQAVSQSRGKYLCFLDADDVMMPQRVRLQYEASLERPTCIIGCQVRREPEGSTERYTRWINGLTQSQLLTQGLSFYFIVLLWRIDSLLQDWKQDVELVTVVSFKNNGN